MIRSIEIRNFRCFRRLKIPDCQRINVIVGDNGSGKTALLEAVFFALGVTTELAQRYRQQRGLTTSFSGSSRKIEEAIWRDYFNNRDWQQTASVVLKGDGPEARSAAIAFSASSVETSAGDPEDSVATAPIRVTWIDADGKPHHAVPSVAAGRIVFPSTDEDLPDFFYFPAQQTIGAIEAAERFADMRRHGRQKEFIDAIRDEFDWICGLDIDVIASAPVVAAVMRDNLLRPLPNVSGGINRIIGVMLTIASRDRSVILLDEAENGIYFKHHSAILRLLLRCVRQYDCQIFLTTHSQEWLYALVGAADEQVDDIALWRVERSRAGPHVVQFDGRTLKAGIEYGAEVRGKKSRPKTFPRLLICEGPEDAFFFQKLIEARNLPRFHIRNAGGNSQFSSAITKFELERTSAYAGLRDILVVADNDDAPSDSFSNVCAHINIKFGAGSVPTAPLKPAKGKPRCTVLMVPWTDIKGNLESLCIDAARNADKAIGDHVDTFLALLTAEKWPSPSRFGKAWLRSNLAGRCAVDPFIPLGKVFNEKRHEHLIPLGDASLNRISDVLARIGQAKCLFLKDHSWRAALEELFSPMRAQVPRRFPPRQASERSL